jgi:chromosome segregation ATPase
MAKSSIHIEPGHGGYFSHNSRQSFSQSQVFFDESNEIGSTKEEAFTLYREELKTRSAAYTKRTKQKLQNKTVTHLSAVVNLEQHHTLKDLKPLTKYLEDELDTKIIQTVIHRDEGKLVHKETGEILTSGEQFFCNPKDKKLYFDKDFKKPIDMSKWEIEKNYHAHIEFMGLTSKGKSIKRELTTWFFRKLQDKTAEVLKMERGEKTKPSYTKEQMKAIKKELKPKKSYTNDKAYGTAFTAIAKKLGYWKQRPKRTKRKDTHDYKAAKAKENELNAKALAKQKDLKTEIAKIRTELQTLKADRSKYAELEQLNKDLKDRIKQKDLTIEELQNTAFKILKKSKKIKGKSFTSETKKSYKLLYEETIENKTDLEAKLTKEKANIKTVYKEDTELTNTLKKQISTQEQTIANKDSEISSLTTQNQALNKKIATLPSLDTLEELKTLRNDFEEKNSDYWELYALAYDENHIETVYDQYGVAQDKTFSYKERYEQSEDKVDALKIKLVEKEDEIKTLEEDLNILTTILSNVSKYLKIGMEKLVELFTDGIPGKEEIEKEQPNKIESVLPLDKHNISYPSNKSMKP